MTKGIGENYTGIYGKPEYPDWSSSSNYEQYDRVNYKGATYAARKANSDVNPFYDDGETWQLIDGTVYESNDTMEVEITNGTLISGRKVNASGGIGSNVTSAGLNIYGIKASKTGYGVIKAGDGINIDDGVISTEHTKPYTLPVASSSTLGGVKVGSGLSIASDGTLSSNVKVQYATKSTSGYVQLGDGLKSENASGLTSVDYGVGLTISNSKLSVKPATTDAIGGVIIGNGISILDGVIDTNITFDSSTGTLIIN